MDIVLTRILECMGNRYGAGKDLANHLGISGNVITNWKNGSNRSVSYTHLTLPTNSLV